jgi:Uma2 family endonuclease
MLVELRRFEIPAGQSLRLRDVTWDEFEHILDDLGNHRGSRLAYDRGVLEIVMPLPEHEDAKEIIGDLVKVLFEELDIEFRSLGSTTFKKQRDKGLEPEQCFYIQHEAQIRGKKRLDLAIDPPPDLAIEIEVTSRTYPSLYAALAVPELWQFNQGTLVIQVLQNGQYVPVVESPNFPGLDLATVLPQFLDRSKTEGRNQVVRSFRQWIQQQNSH